MKILVTGGAGYIGSVMVPILLNEGYEVTVLDNFTYRQQSLLDCCYYPTLMIKRGDVRDESLIKKLMKDADVIFPLAALVGAPLCDRDPVSAKTINYDAVKLILDNRSKDQRIIFPTTNSGYGVGEDNVYCTEETPMRPVSLYGRLKVDIEKAVLDAGNGITLRLATVFGISPRPRLDLLVNDFTYRAVNDRFIVLFEAHFKRNYVHIRDVANAFIHCVKNFDAMKGGPFNVGLSDANLSKMELCEEIKKQVPEFHILESKIGKDPDQRNYIVSNEKIEKTGFRTENTLQLGIAELVKGFQILKNNQYCNV